MNPLPDRQYVDAHPDSGSGRAAIDRFLRNLDIDTLLVCCVVTNGCVEGTVRDASDLGWHSVPTPVDVLEELRALAN